MAYFNQHQSMISKRYLTFFSKSKKKKPFSAGQLIGLILGPLLFLLTLLFFHPQDLPWKASCFSDYFMDCDLVDY